MTYFRTIRSLYHPFPGLLLGSLVAAGMATHASASIIAFNAAGATPASITSTVNDFRTQIGGGTTPGANGDFGGVRREINWDGVPAAASDPNLMPADFFNTTSPRGAVFSTPGTGFLVSGNVGAALFGFAGDLQTFSPAKLFTAVNSNITDVNFFVPGTTTAATTSAFGVVFVDVETANLTKIDFFDTSNTLLFTQFAQVAGNQGLSFVGGVANAGERIARVRITSGANTIVSNGVLGNQTDDLVVMDDFIYGTPTAAAAATPEPGSLSLLGLGIVAFGCARKKFRR